MFTVHKTTLSVQNRGICGNRNNTRYNGGTVCWRLDWNGENYGALSRKKHADLVAKIFNEIAPNWDGIGDHFAMAVKMGDEAQREILYDMKEV